MDKCDHDSLAVICASLWACWLGRNKIIMENKTCDFVHMSTSFVRMLHEYNQYTMKVAVFRDAAALVPRTPQVMAGSKPILMLLWGMIAREALEQCLETKKAALRLWLSVG